MADGVDRPASPSSKADIGGLVARGDGTAVGNPKLALLPARLNPRLDMFGVGGGLVALVDGAVPLLNSAQRGHFRLVSNKESGERNKNQNMKELLMCPI
jgi:hypothetical protein